MALGARLRVCGRAPSFLAFCGFSIKLLDALALVELNNAQVSSAFRTTGGDGHGDVGFALAMGVNQLAKSMR